MEQIESRWPAMALVAAFMLVVITMNDGTRAAESCPALLTDQECRAYLTHRERATSPNARVELERRYAALLKERAKLCPSGSVVGRQPVDHPALEPRADRRIWM